MGVPSFFYKLIQHFKQHQIHDIITYINNLQIDNLFFDANCLYHQIVIISKTNDTNLIIDNIIKYIQKIIDLVKPKQVYIMEDGVVPLSKIRKQQLRRYRKLLEKEESDKFNNIQISPQTEFMKLLSQRIKKYNWIYSDSSEFGEGEFKIFKILKNNELNNMIYGLDADLIFLSLINISDKNRIVLIRESKEVDKDNQLDEYVYVNIQRLKEEINKIMDSNGEDLINDYIFVTFLIGNDFIANMEMIDIRMDGLDFLIDTYKIIKKNRNDRLINNNEMNINFVMEWFKFLSIREPYIFNKIIDHKRIHKKKKNSQSRYINDINEREKFRNDHLLNKHNLLMDNNDTIDENIMRYYEENFNCSYRKDMMIDEICYNYMKSIKWTMNYYFKGEITWRWYYKYRHAPLMSNLSRYLRIKKKEVEMIKLEEDEPLNVETQKVLIFPKELKGYIEKELWEVYVEKEEYYPDKFEIDYNDKYREWQGDILLPEIDINEIDYIMSK